MSELKYIENELRKKGYYAQFACRPNSAEILRVGAGVKKMDNGIETIISYHEIEHKDGNLYLHKLICGTHSDVKPVFECSENILFLSKVIEAIGSVSKNT